MINNKYQVSFVVKPEGHLPNPQLWEAFVTEKRCIELQSLVEKSFDEYIKLKGIIQNFFELYYPKRGNVRINRRNNRIS
jgi:hypothetical protein